MCAGLSLGLNKHIRLNDITKENTETFFQKLAKTGAIEVKLYSTKKDCRGWSKIIAVRRGHIHEDIENPSTRTGKETFFEVSASFPLNIAKRAEIAQLIVQGMLLAQTPIKDIGRIEDNRMVVAWRLKIK